jgi:hypothetical protein
MLSTRGRLVANGLGKGRLLSPPHVDGKTLAELGLRQ